MMKLRSLIKQTWTTGLLLFGFLACRNNTPKLTEIIEEETTDNKV